MTNDGDNTASFGQRENNEVSKEQSRPIVPKSATEVLRPEPGVPPPKRSRKARSQTVIFMNFIMSLMVFAEIVEH